MAPVDIQTAVHALQALMRAIPGIVDAPNAPLEDFVGDPFIVSYLGPDGSTDPLPGGLQSGGKKKELHTIYTEAHFGRGLGPEAIERSLVMFPLIIDVLCKNPTLSGTVDTIRYPIRHGFGYLSWAEEENVHVGFRFEIDVKLQTAIA